jgi:aspartate 1-decarboxylase
MASKTVPVYATLLKAKLHGAHVTEAHLEYEGSLSVDEDLMDAVKLDPYEKILVANMENGSRFETYIIPGPRGSGVIALNGATVHMGCVGDRVIIFSFCLVPSTATRTHRPMILRVDDRNRPAGPLLP